MSGALALLLAGTTVASMVPAFTVNAEGQDTATGTTYYVDSKVEVTAMTELPKARHSRHLIK